MELPSEATILETTLLPPSALHNIISLKTFTNLFPANQRSNPQIKLLYRALQHQRALDLDHVRDNIAIEAIRGEKQQREVARVRRQGAQALQQEEWTTNDDGWDERDAEMEDVLYDTTHDQSSSSRPHTLTSIIPALESACSALEAETEELEGEAAQLLRRLETMVGDLSDLRYGKFSRPELRDEALEGLEALERVCDEKGAGKVEMDGEGEIEG